MRTRLVREVLDHASGERERQLLWMDFLGRVLLTKVVAEHLADADGGDAGWLATVRSHWSGNGGAGEARVDVTLSAFIRCARTTF